MADLSAGARLKTNVVTLPGVLILFALFNSAIAVSIACMNASARFLYGMSRAKALPGSLTKVHPVYATPTNAIITQTGSTWCSACCCRSSSASLTSTT
jgi:amino acid transporter